MTLRISYSSDYFPSPIFPRAGHIDTSWHEILWAALTVGRPNIYHVFRFGPASFHEAIFRLSLIRMAIERSRHGDLLRTDAFAALDATEKGMVSYFLGMTFCKLFSARLLQTPWLLHLDAFRQRLPASLLGRSRPDLIGQNANGQWHAFECKGRSSVPSTSDIEKAKAQAQRLISVNGVNCTYNIGAFTFFRSDILEFYWIDPDPDIEEPFTLPDPEREWRYYYEPAYRLASEADSRARFAERSRADVTVEIHPKIRRLLDEQQWTQAKSLAQDIRQMLINEGYQPDGLKVTAGESWMKPYEFPFED